jgi:small conductance mechanosensitive channel
MEPQMTRMQRFGELMVDRGPETILSLVLLIVGLLLIKWIVRNLRTALGKVIRNTTIVSIICNIAGILLLALVIISASAEAGLKLEPIISALTVISLAAVGAILLFRPLIPTMPFKVGQTVKAGDLLGKIEAMTILNTRFRTFDGKTFFVPNRKILDDIVINYQVTETRRIKLDVGIRSDQDLMKAKQTLEILMITDPRVKAKPAPVVYVLDTSNGRVKLGGRCWVDNAKYWVAKCDLLEKAKFALFHAGIVPARQQMDLHHFNNGYPGPVAGIDPENDDEFTSGIAAGAEAEA